MKKNVYFAAVIFLSLALCILSPQLLRAAETSPFSEEGFGKILGQGSFGKVVALPGEASTVVKYSEFSWDDGAALINLREAIILKHLNHRHIIKPKKIAWYTHHHKKHLLLYLPRALPMKKNLPDLLHASAEALDYLHSHGMAHTDLKPQHLMQVGDDIKLVDFGSTELEVSRPQKYNKTTNHYRSPENLFGLYFYPRELDIWSLGIAVLYFQHQGKKLNEIFKLHDTNDVTDRMIHGVFKTFGTPDFNSGFYQPLLKKKHHLLLYADDDPVAIRYPIKPYPKPLLSELFPEEDTELVDLLSKMLDFDPRTRITAQEILTHPYVREGISPRGWSSREVTSSAPVYDLPTGLQLEFLRDEYIKLNFSIQNYQLGDHIFFDSAAIFAQMIASTGKVIPDPEQAEMIRRAAITLALVLNDEVLNAARLVEKLSLRPAYGAVLTSFMEEFLTYTNFDILHDHAYRRAAWEGKTQGVEARPYINDLKSQVLLSADPYLFP